MMEKPRDSLTSNEVHVLGYGRQTSKWPLSHWCWLLLTHWGQSVLRPSIMRLHPAGCCYLTLQPSTYRDANYTQAPAIFFVDHGWPCRGCPCCHYQQLSQPSLPLIILLFLSLVVSSIYQLGQYLLVLSVTAVIQIKLHTNASIIWRLRGRQEC